MLSCASPVQSLSSLDHVVHQSLNSDFLLIVGEEKESVEVAIASVREEGSHDTLLIDIGLRREG